MFVILLCLRISNTYLFPNADIPIRKSYCIIFLVKDISRTAGNDYLASIHFKMST